MKRIFTFALVVLPVALLAQSPALVESTVVSLYRGTSKVQDLPSWESCQARARELANASTQTSGTVTYSCKTEVRKLVATYSPAPTPVDCQVSPFVFQSATAWSACSAGQQTRTETWARTVTTPASGGGAACPALTETRTATQACTPPIDPPASLLFASSWENGVGSVPGCTFDLLIDGAPGSASRWDDYGGSGACSGTVHDADVVTLPALGGRALRVNQKPGNQNGTDFRIVKAFGTQTSATATFKVYFPAGDWQWASNDHKMWIWLDGACTSQNVYINTRGNDATHARIAVHVLPSDTVLSDRNVTLTTGVVYRIRSYVVAGAQGSVDVWLQPEGQPEVKLNLVQEAGNPASASRLNTGTLGCGKLDTTYNLGSAIPAAGYRQYFDSIAVYRGLFGGQ